MIKEQAHTETSQVAVKIDPKAFGIGAPGKLYDKN